MNELIGIVLFFLCLWYVNRATDEEAERWYKRVREKWEQDGK